MGVLYEHWRMDTNECFYVGISWAQEDTRPYDLSPRNPFYGNVVSKIGTDMVDVRIQADGLTKDELCELETLQIAYWRDFIGDRLTNIAQGGEGLIVWTDDLRAQQRKKSSELWDDPTYRGKQKMTRSDPDWVARHSKLQSELKKGKPVPYLHTPEATAKRAKKHSDARKGKPVPHLQNELIIQKRINTLRELQLPAKPVINLMTGEKFPSAKAAANHYNVRFEDYVADSCRKYEKGIYRLVGKNKYVFAFATTERHAGEPVFLDAKVIQQEHLAERRAKDAERAANGELTSSQKSTKSRLENDAAKAARGEMTSGQKVAESRVKNDAERAANGEKTSSQKMVETQRAMNLERAAKGEQTSSQKMVETQKKNDAERAARGELTRAQKRAETLRKKRETKAAEQAAGQKDF